ncbi:MAG: hypothetical protein CMJ46_06080 [Planctomyces sp.]|nr:hypothetical protein [Planctomyces sp.]
MLVGLISLSAGVHAGEVPSGQELNARHVGEYAAVPWVADGVEIAPGSRQDRVRDLNLSVASVNLKDDSSDAYIEAWNTHAQRAGELGYAFLPRVHFWDGRDRFEGPLRDIEVYWNRLDRFLGAVDLENFTGIVLAEENVHYGGRPEVLTELYHRVKEKYDVEVWQWWSPMDQVPASGGWIPADGWVIDLYFMGQPQFRRQVQKYLVTGKPLVVMPWAGQMDFNRDLTESQWAANQAQLDTAVEYNLPVAFFWVYGTGTHFGGDRNPPQTEMNRINHWVWDYIERVRQLPSDYDGFDTADSGTGDIQEIGPTEADRLVYFDGFADQKWIDDASVAGFRDFRMDGEALSVQGYRGRDIDCSIEYEFAGKLAASYPQVGLDALRNEEFDGEVELAVSTTGEDWITTTQKQGGPAHLQLATMDHKEFAATNSFHVRIRVKGKSLGANTPVVKLDNLRIDSGIEAPENREVELVTRDGDSSSLQFTEEFLSQKFRYDADINNLDQIEWYKGRIGVRLRPGGTDVALVWKVTAPVPVRHIQVRMDGRANRVHLGAYNYLDISPDGEQWSHETNTSDKEVDGNGWVRESLTIDTGDDSTFDGVTEFYVRVRLKTIAFEKLHPSLAGQVEKIIITAEK